MWLRSQIMDICYVSQDFSILRIVPNKKRKLRQTVFFVALFSLQIDCDGLFIGFSFKLLILLFGSWALFFRPTKATMPRIYLFRACICTLLFVFIFAFWLFYGVRVFDETRRRIQYQDLVYYANTMLDTMLFIHYLAIILMEIKHISPQ